MNKTMVFIIFICIVCIGNQKIHIQTLEKEIINQKQRLKELDSKEYMAIKKCQNEVRWKNDCILWELNKVDK